MTSPQMRPARPREPRPQAVAAIARRNTIRNLDRQIDVIRQNSGANDPRINELLEQRHAISTRQETP